MSEEQHGHGEGGLKKNSHLFCCVGEMRSETLIRSPEMQQMTCRRVGMEEERVRLWAEQ